MMNDVSKYEIEDGTVVRGAVVHNNEPGLDGPSAHDASDGSLSGALPHASDESDLGQYKGGDMEDKRDTPFAGEYGEFEDAYDHTQMGRVAKIVAIHAGVSTPSTSSMLTDRIIGATRSALEKDSRIASVSVYALRPLVNDIALASVGGPISNALQEIIDALCEADGAIVVTPVFQSSYSGLFKSFFDILPENTMRDLPVVMGATAGSVRHSLVAELAMRPLFAYLKALPTTLAVFAASEDFGASVPDGDATDTVSPLVSRIDRAGREFARFIESFPRKAPVDAMSDFAPMESLLKR